MSDKCGNCDCADKSQCVKKGNSYIVVDIVSTHKSCEESYVMDGAATGEHDGSASVDRAAPAWTALVVTEP